MMPAIKKQSDIYLSELAKDIDQITVKQDCLVHSIQIDSRLIGVGDLFVALPGVQGHGLTYLSEVAAAGASCVLYQRSDASEFDSLLAVNKEIVKIEVDDVRLVAGEIISKYYGEPSKNINIIGVTGTDGKTSVSRFVTQALSVDQKSAVIGTTGNGLWGELLPATHTTPDVLSMHKLLAELENKSAANVVMEISSHGIDQKRIAGVDVNTAILTNVSRDHLDYHGTVENYQETKKQLFTQKSIKNVIVNLDDPIGRELAKDLCADKNVWGYSLKPINNDLFNIVYAESIVTTASGFNVEVMTPLGAAEIKVPLMGRFNISNALTVLSVLLLHKVGLEKAVSRIKKIETAPGRMEVFAAKNNPMIVVDFAHTPKALELALKALTEHCEGEVWCVFGCGGDRDEGKRSLMGRVAEEHAHHIVVTDDNLRSESSESIINQITLGFVNKDNAKVVPDRKQAIKYAFVHAKEIDVILIAGKGHEEFQIVGDLRIPFSDVDEVKKLIGGDQ